MVDIDGDVVDMCREHTPFYSEGAYGDKRTRLIIGDAKEGLANEPDGSFDVIIMDLSDPLDGGRGAAFATCAFSHRADRWRRCRFAANWRLIAESWFCKHGMVGWHG